MQLLTFECWTVVVGNESFKVLVELYARVFFQIEFFY